MSTLRVAFVLGVLLFAWLGLRGRFDEVGATLHHTSLAGLVAGLALVLLGLSATGVLWLRTMAVLGARLPVVPGLATFFVGQLGKYIPGSVWSIGAQAGLARRDNVPTRVTVAAGLLFLGYHVDTAVLLGAGALLAGRLDSPWPAWVSWVALVVAVVGLLPPVVRLAAGRVAGRDVQLTGTDTATTVVLMASAWATYALALVLICPGAPWGDLTALGGAFAAAYAVGVVVVFAPAGVGAREGVFVLLLAPIIGVGEATALALLARVVHTGADALMAAGWWLAARRFKVPRVRSGLG
jgi:hypothetical protein